MLALLLATATQAAPLVVRADLSTLDAARQVARDAQLSEHEVDPVTLTGLVGGRAPFFVDGRGEVIPCGKPPTTAEAVRAAGESALNRLLQLEYKEALFAVDDALQTLGCQRDIIDPAAAAQLYFLKGLIQIDWGSPKRAQAAFRQALVYQPDLAWDKRFPPNGSELLEAARADLTAAEPAQLSIMPKPEDLTILVDGLPQEIPHSFPAGEHVVQLQGATTTTVRLTLEPGAQATLVVPGLLEESHAYAVTEDDSGADLIAALTPVIGTDTSLWVVTPTGTWHRDPAADRFSLVATHKPRTRRYIKANWQIAGAGAAIALGGGVLAALSYADAASATQEAGNATSWAEYQAAGEHHDTAESRFFLTAGVAASGLAIGVVGASFPLGRVVPRGEP